jgi:hypothetical protein
MAIVGIAHVNLTVPPGTLEQAAEFYENTLGFTRVPVPVLQKETLAWLVSPLSFLPCMPSSSEKKYIHFCISAYPTLPHAPAYIRVLFPL